MARHAKRKSMPEEMENYPMAPLMAGGKTSYHKRGGTIVYADTKKQNAMQEIFERCLAANKDKLPDRLRNTSDVEAYDQEFEKKIESRKLINKFGHNSTHYNEAVYYPVMKALDQSCYKKEFRRINHADARPARTERRPQSSIHHGALMRKNHDYFNLEIAVPFKDKNIGLKNNWVLDAGTTQDRNYVDHAEVAKALQERKQKENYNTYRHQKSSSVVDVDIKANIYKKEKSKHSQYVEDRMSIAYDPKLQKAAIMPYSMYKIDFFNTNNPKAKLVMGAPEQRYYPLSFVHKGKDLKTSKQRDNAEINKKMEKAKNVDMQGFYMR